MLDIETSIGPRKNFVVLGGDRSKGVLNKIF